MIGELDAKIGGTYTALVLIVKMLDKIGHNSFIIATRKGNEILEFDFFKDRYLLFDKSFPKKYRQSSQAVDCLETNIHEFDGIIIHEIWGGIGISACLAARKKKKEYYIWPHGSLDPFDLQKKTYFKKALGLILINKILYNAKYICCTSNDEKDKLVVFGRRKNNVVVLPIMVEYDGLVIGNKSNFRKKFNIREDQFVYLFLSRINYKKGLDSIIYALHSLIKQKSIIRDDIRLIIAGTGDDEYVKYIEDLVVKLKLAEIIIFTGQLSGLEKADAFVGSDVFVLPSKNENFGIAIVESLQSGTPVIITKNVYIHSLLFSKDFEPGWICENVNNDLERCLLESYKQKNVLKLKNDSLSAGRLFQPDLLEISYKNIFYEKASIDS